MERSCGFPSNHFQNKAKTPEFDKNTEPVLGTLLLTKSEPITPEFDANTEPVLRTLISTKSEAKIPEFEANTEPVVRIYF